MARLEIDIVGNNTELKKILADSKIALSNFNKELEKSGSNKAKSEVEGLRNELALQKVETEKARTEAVKLASIISGSLAESLNNAKVKTEGAKQSTESYKQSLLDTKKVIEQGKQAITDSNVSLISQRQETEKAKTATQQARQAIAELTLANKQNKSAVDVASGSYREAQQRLTAMGKAIRENANGFDLNNPKVRQAVNEYNALNNKLKEFDKAMGNNQRNVGNYGSALAGAIPALSQFTSVAGAAAGIVGILGNAGRVLFSFDSGMKNVEKTTGLTRVEVEKLGDELLSLSKSIGVITPTKLAEYATAAGQLGVKGTRDILNFTETLAKLETATNISGEEGASEIARTLTLLDGGVQNVKQFGDEIVNLGNNFAATEKEILGNAESIAQNVGIYKIGRQDVLAFATATKAVGIEAELVGSTFSRTLAVFENAIRTGDGVQTILKLIGGTQAELSKRFKEDASGVFVDFIGALNKIDKEGGSVNEQLEALSINAVRDQRVIQSLAVNGYDVLTRALETSKTSAGALTKEFGVQSEKLSNSFAQIKVAWEELILSIDSGNGQFSQILRMWADDVKNILTDLRNVFGKSNVGGGGFITGYDALRQIGVRGYEDFLPKAKAVEVAEQKIGEQVKRNKAYWEDQVNSIRESIEALDVNQAGTKRWIELNKQLASAQSNVNLFGTSTRGGSSGGNKGKSQTDLIKEANEALRGGQIGNLKGIDSELEKIDKKWDSILEKVNKIANVELKNQLRVQVDQGRELDKQIAKLDAFSKSKGLKALGVTAGTVTPTFSGIPSIAPLQKSIAGFTAGLGAKGFDDAEAKQLEREISRIVKGGVRRGFDDIIGNITDLGSNFYQVFTNVFGKLASSIQGTLNDVVGNALGNLVKENFGNIKFGNLSKEVSQGIVAGVGALGGVLGGVFKGTDATGQAVSGALSGAAAGLALGPIGAIAGGLIGALSGIFGAKERKRQLALQEEQLKEQRKQTALQERANALAYSSSIIGQMSNRGVVQGVDVNEFGELVFRIEGRDLVATMSKEQEAQKRGL